MKNQYVGDVGDYGKYGLLRYLSEQGILVGVNWYLTENDGSNDGKHISYLSKEKERIFDPVVFDALKGIARLEEKNVQMIENSGIIPNACYFNELLNTTDAACQMRERIRQNWHRRALESLSAAQIVFADPDNGTMGKKKPTSRNGEKYATLGELAYYYNRGQDVMYYCQRARRTDAQWREKKREFLSVASDAKIIVLTFRRGTQRSYIFGIHPEHYERYDCMIDDFIKTAWGTAGKNAPYMRVSNDYEDEYKCQNKN